MEVVASLLLITGISYSSVITRDAALCLFLGSRESQPMRRPEIKYFNQPLAKNGGEVHPRQNLSCRRILHM